MTPTGIIIVDHGSRRQASNDMLHAATRCFADQSVWSIVEAAHMELAQPDIATAYSRCVDQGARRIVVFPYFLSPGRHWSQDIPRLVATAAEPFPGTEWLVTAPFGLHKDMPTIISDRIQQCLGVSDSGDGHCDVCDGDDHRELRSAGHRGADNA